MTYQCFLKYTFSNGFIDVSSGWFLPLEAEWLLFFAESTQSAEETQGSIIKDNPKNMLKCADLWAPQPLKHQDMCLSRKPLVLASIFRGASFKKNLRQLKLEAKKKNRGQDLSAKKNL